MKLTNECKVAFEKWYNQQTFEKRGELPPLIYDDDFKFAWTHLTDSMQYGVYVDFFDSVEDKTKVRVLPRVSRGFDCYFTELKECLQLHDTRPKARIEAIKKANEIYNDGNSR